MAFDEKDFEDQAWNDPSVLAGVVMLVIIILALVGGGALWNYVDPPPAGVHGPIAVEQGR